MPAGDVLICASEALAEGGDGVRFTAPAADGEAKAFVVRYGGKPRAFLNRCAHVPVELDWEPGKFFDLTGHYLVCAVHGAHYEAGSGRCVMGPCAGRTLVTLPVEERDGGIFLKLGSCNV